MTPEHLLFEYLREIIYTDNAGKYEVKGLPENPQDLGEGLNLLSRWMCEAREYSRELSAGNFNAVVPSKDNQHVDFMGEFSTAFNTMIDQLKTRRENLEKSRRLFMEITDGIKKETYIFRKSFSFGISYIDGDNQEKKETILRNTDLKMYEFKMRNKLKIATI